MTRFVWELGACLGRKHADDTNIQPVSKECQRRQCKQHTVELIFLSKTLELRLGTFGSIIGKQPTRAEREDVWDNPMLSHGSATGTQDASFVE